MTLLAAAALLIVCGGGSYLYLSGRLDWPFALRYSEGAFDDPQLSPALLLALWTAICRSTHDELIKVLALYRGGGPIEGAEFLLDGAGLIRAAWSPGGRPNWTIPDELDREIAAIRDNPRASRPRGAHPHGR